MKSKILKIFLPITVICCIFIATLAVNTAIAGEETTTSKEAEDDANSGNPQIDNTYWMRLGACGNRTYPSPSANLSNVDNEYRVIQLKFQPANEVFPGFTKRLVSCIQKIVKDIADSQLEAILGTFATAANTFVILYIIYFGIKVVTGNVRSLKSDMIVAAITVSLVIFAVSKSGINEYLNLFIDAQQALVGMVTESVIKTEAPFGGNGADKNLCRYYIDTWQRLDCVLAYYIGVDPKEFAGEPGGFAIASYEGFNDFGSSPQVGAEKRTGITLGLWVGVMGLLFSSDIGIILGLFALLIPILMIAAFAQAITVYIGALVVIVFLAVLAPLIIPMVLFPSTNAMFKFWFQMLLSYTLLPAVVMSYLTFMVHIIGTHFTETSSDPLTNSLSQIYEKIYGAVDVINNGPTDPNAEILTPSFTVSGTGSTAFMQNFSAKVAGSATTDLTGNNQQSGGIQLSNAGSEVGVITVPDFILTLDAGEDFMAIYDIGSPPGDPETTGNGQIEGEELEKLLDARKAGESNFLYQLITTLILFALTFGFMVNVSQFGGSLAGISANPVNQSMNVYNNAVRRLTAGNK